MKVYDSFLFFNELDLLEIRLNLLDTYVDHFIISESTVTFSGKPKPLYYLENKERFRKFEKKIIHQVIRDTPDDFSQIELIDFPKTKDEQCLNRIFQFIQDAVNFPKNETHWGRDFFQRESLHRAYVDCADEDIILFSDVDEIPNPEILKDLFSEFPSQEIFTLRQKEFNYYLNAYKQDGWRGPRAANFSVLKDKSLNQIRTILPGDQMLVQTIDVPNGGWHFTSLGGVEKVIHKIESWGHQEFNTDEIKNRVQENIESGRDIFLRGKQSLEVLKVDETNFPKWIVENISSYTHLLSPKLKDEGYFFEKIKKITKKILKSAF